MTAITSGLCEILHISAIDAGVRAAVRLPAGAARHGRTRMRMLVASLRKHRIAARALALFVLTIVLATRVSAQGTELDSKEEVYQRYRSVIAGYLQEAVEREKSTARRSSGRSSTRPIARTRRPRSCRSWSRSATSSRACWPASTPPTSRRRASRNSQRFSPQPTRPCSTPWRRCGKSISTLPSGASLR